jgi:hypothetical protein
MGEPGAQPRGDPVELGADGVEQTLLLAGSLLFRNGEQRLLLTEEPLDSRKDLEVVRKRREILRIPSQSLLGSWRSRHDDLIPHICVG